MAVDKTTKLAKAKFFILILKLFFAGRAGVFVAADPHAVLQHRRDLQPLRQGRQALP